MKKLSTILCSLLFVIAGAMVIGMRNKESPSLFIGNMEAYAGQSYVNRPLPYVGLPLDVQLDLTKRAKPDTVYIDTSRVDTVFKTEYKTKIRKVPVPEVVEKHDTLLVPVFYIATPLEHEVESTEIRVIDDVHINSSLQTNQTDSVMSVSTFLLGLISLGTNNTT